MTRHRELKPRVRFTSRAYGRNGIGVDEAVRRAEARIEPLKGRILAHINDLVDQMLGMGGDPASQAGPDVPQLRSKADSVVGLCGNVSCGEIQSVAISLCRMLDSLKGEEVNPAAVHVHLDALRLFRDSSPAIRAQVAPSVLDGLKRLSAFRPRTAAA